MARLYAILAVVGWAWTLVVLIYVAWRWSRSRRDRGDLEPGDPKRDEGKVLP
jgi:hypothetical protein